MSGDVGLRLDWMISVDDHVLEPAGVWQDRVPAKWKELAPQLREDADGEAWFFEGRRFPTGGLAAVAGKKYEEITPHAIRYSDMREGCYDPVARVADMDLAGVVASLNFPSFARFAGQTFLEADDPELALVCVRAWNDWMLDEWCAAAPGRFIPGCIVPFWDMDETVREIERVVDKGCRGIIFTENPAKLKHRRVDPLPSIHDAGRFWDPLFAAVSEAGVPLCMHYGSSSVMAKTSEDAPYLVSLASNSFILPISTTLDWIFSGNLARFPDLKICMSESQIGWVVPMLERAEYVWKIQGDWNRRLMHGGTLEDHSRGIFKITEREEELVVDERSCTEVFRDQIFCTFFEDFAGVVAMAENDLLDNIMIEMDYPHTDSTWPDSIGSARRQVAGLSEEQQWKVLAGNAIKIHGFEPAYPQPATV